jgi:hypothetical protein
VIRAVIDANVVVSGVSRHLSRRTRVHADGEHIPWPLEIIEDEPTEAQR